MSSKSKGNTLIQFENNNTKERQSGISLERHAVQKSNIIQPQLSKNEALVKNYQYTSTHKNMNYTQGVNLGGFINGVLNSQGQ